MVCGNPPPTFFHSTPFWPNLGICRNGQVFSTIFVDLAPKTIMSALFSPDYYTAPVLSSGEAGGSHLSGAYINVTFLHTKLLRKFAQCILSKQDWLELHEFHPNFRGALSTFLHHNLASSALLIWNFSKSAIFKISLNLPLVVSAFFSPDYYTALVLSSTVDFLIFPGVTSRWTLQVKFGIIKSVEESRSCVLKLFRCL